MQLGKGNDKVDCFSQLKHVAGRRRRGGEEEGGRRRGNYVGFLDWLAATVEFGRFAHKRKCWCSLCCRFAQICDRLA